MTTLTVTLTATARQAYNQWEPIVRDDQGRIWWAAGTTNCLYGDAAARAARHLSEGPMRLPG